MELQTQTDGRADAAPTPTLDDLHPLIAALSSHDVLARTRARQALVEMGAPVVDQLIVALDSPNHTTRWEAAKALGEIAEPRAAPALIAALDDGRFDVRWLAATGLIALRDDSLIPLLEALVQAPWGKGYLHEGAHHILRAQLGGAYATTIAPVVSALEGSEPSLTVPLAAYRALGTLRDALSR